MIQRILSLLVIIVFTSLCTIGVRNICVAQLPQKGINIRLQHILFKTNDSTYQVTKYNYPDNIFKINPSFANVDTVNKYLSGVFFVQNGNSYLVKYELLSSIDTFISPFLLDKNSWNQSIKEGSIYSKLQSAYLISMLLKSKIYKKSNNIQFRIILPKELPSLYPNSESIITPYKCSIIEFEVSNDGGRLVKYSFHSNNCKTLEFCAVDSFKISKRYVKKIKNDVLQVSKDSTINCGANNSENNIFIEFFKNNISYRNLIISGNGDCNHQLKNNVFSILFHCKILAKIRNE